MKEALLKKIENREITVGVVGSWLCRPSTSCRKSESRI